MFHTSSVEALTSLTASAIEGNRPSFVSTSEAENKVGFTLDGQFYSEYDDNIKGSEIKEFDGKYTLSDFIISDKLAAKLSETSNYNDVDGDKFDSFDIKLESYSWKDASGKTIASADYSKIIGCGSGYSMPLTLQINQQAKPSSQYGVPREGVYSTFTKTYQIASKPELCAAKPNSAVIYPNRQWDGVDTVNDGIYFWNDPNYTQRNSKTGGGYSIDYLPNLGGFKLTNISTGKTFPTTGFPHAKFQLLMAGSQTDYKYVILSNHTNDTVNIDKDGFITLYKKPKGKVTARAILKRDEKVNFDYSFEITSSWVVPQGGFTGNWEQAKIRCNGIQNIVTRKELTNSPFIKPENGFLSNCYTRAIDGTVFSEWGWADENTYPRAGWRLGMEYWLFDPHVATITQHIVHSHDGFIGYRANERDDLSVVCRG